MIFDSENPYVLNSQYFSNVTTLTYDQTLLSTVTFLINTFCFLFGISLNFLLIFLILKKTPKVFKDYSHLIFICTLVDLLYIIINFLTQFVSIFVFFKFGSCFL